MKNGLIIDKHGTKEYYLNNKKHREDGPAEEWADGSQFWYIDGEKHREDGPADEWAHGDTLWYLHGKLHRENGPAIEMVIGIKQYYLNDELHREDGPAVELENGDTFWYLHDKELIHPTEFETMEAFFKELNDNEEYSLQWINKVNGIINMIKKPSGKQSRLNAMRWKI